MEDREIAARAFAQVALLNIVVQGILDTLTPEQVTKIRAHLELAAPVQEAHLVAGSVPDAVPTAFAELCAQLLATLSLTRDKASDRQTRSPDESRGQ